MFWYLNIVLSLFYLALLKCGSTYFMMLVEGYGQYTIKGISLGAVTDPLVILAKTLLCT